LSNAKSGFDCAVMTISGGMVSTSTYDSNGIQISGNGRATTWTSYNKPASITQGSSTIGFIDGSDHLQLIFISRF
jgi:hypothetical protein